MIDGEEPPRQGSIERAMRGSHLSMSFGNTKILDDVSIDVPPSSIYAVIGGSGTGKSTMLRVLAGLQQPDTGNVQICGINMRTHPFEARSRVGYMPETFGDFDNISVTEYLNYFAALYGISRALRRPLRDDLIDLADLEAKSHDAIGTLSRGMKQRLSLVRCLIHEPDVLLLDEPVSALPAADRDNAWVMLQELAELGKTIVFTAHDECDVVGICSGWLTLRNGFTSTPSPAQPDFRSRTAALPL